MKRQHILLPAIVISLFLLQPTFAALPRYEVIDLGTLGGGYSCAYAINEAGQVVGGSGDHAFFWEDTNGNGQSDPCEMQDLGTLGHDNSIAISINEFGQVVGYSYSYSPYYHSSAFLWEDINQNGHADPGEMQNLGTISGGSRYRAFGINNKGQVVGHFKAQVNFPAYPWHAFLWDRTSGMKDVSILTGDKIHYARSINDAGQVVGSLHYIWDNNTNQLTRMELPHAWEVFTCTGKVINNSGQVTGFLHFLNGNWRPFLWEDGEMINLGTLGGRMSYANGMNEIGQVVGNSTPTYANDLLNHAFLWDIINGIVDLNNALPADSKWKELRYALDINNRGQIVGYGATEAGELHPFLMTPVPRTIYVDDDASGAKDGSSWANAYKYLQDALAAAYSGDEIRVAQGIYTPDSNSANPNGSGDRTATFQLKNGVTLKGGYAGLGQPDPNARDIKLYETILSGDLEGNDGPNFTHNDDNSYHVVTGNGTDKTAVFDGFIITAGNANHPWEALWRRGGGMYNSGGSPTLTNCKFGANSAVGGGAIYITGEFQGTFTDCVFENNAASKYGGAIYLTGTGELNIIRCEFRDGSAERGGAIYSYASLVLSQCILVNNQAKYAGAINTDGDITLTNCLLANNHALVWGGALSNMMNTSRSVNCTFVGNSANFGGAISSNIECDTIAINSIFWNNTAQTGSQIATSGSHGGSTLTVNYCDIENLLDGLYVPSGCTLNWGEDNINAEPLFADSDNGDYRLSASSPCVDVGDSNFIAEPNETDLDGKPRVLDGDNDGVLVVDMGAYEYRFTISAEARIIPKTINLASKGNWITSYIWLPEEYNVADIEPNSVFLDDEIQPEQFSVDEQQQIATARFSREKVQAILNVGDVELTITGQLTDGTVFEGTDTIKVIDKARKK